MGELDDRPGERLPSIIGFGSGQHQQIPLGEPDTPHDQLRPGQLGQSPIDDLQGRPTSAIVEQRVRIERRDIGRVIEQVFQRGRRGAPGVDPAVEGGHERGRDEIAGITRTARPGQRVEAHARKSTRASLGAPPAGTEPAFS
jgi:hypothetical protein